MLGEVCLAEALSQFIPALAYACSLALGTAVLTDYYYRLVLFRTHIVGFAMALVQTCLDPAPLFDYSYTLIMLFSMVLASFLTRQSRDLPALGRADLISAVWLGLAAPKLFAGALCIGIFLQALWFIWRGINSLPLHPYLAAGVIIFNYIYL